MSLKCVIRECRSVQDKNCGLSFFKFPLNDPGLLAQWTAAVNKEFWIPTAFCKICELHFKEEYLAGGKRRKRLKLNAKPTENLGTTVHVHAPQHLVDDTKHGVRLCEETTVHSHAPQHLVDDIEHGVRPCEGEPQQIQYAGKIDTEVQDISTIVTSVLKELGLIGRNDNKLKQTGKEIRITAKDTGGKKGKHRDEREGRLGNETHQSQQLTQRQVQKTQQDTWTTVVKKGKKKNAKIPLPQQQQTQQVSGRSNEGNLGGLTGRKTTPSNNNSKLGKVPKSPAVVVTSPSGQYGEVLREARNKIDLDSLGIKEIRPRKAVTGALILEIPDDKEGNKANALAAKMMDLFANRKEVKISRPYKRAEIRIKDIDDLVDPDEIVQILAKEGGCDPGQIKLGEIKWTLNGLGTVWAQCPLDAAKRITIQKKVQIGWFSYRVETLPARPLQCYRCLEPGHVSAICKSTEDRSLCCYRCGQTGHKSSTCARPLKCPACQKAGLKASHKIGTSLCSLGGSR